ncbi:MAG: site-specific integrase [Ignavibacteria bacterium]|nr:site-specific integrase [Ignavibacteria bacterium]
MDLPPALTRDVRQFLQYIRLERGLADTTRMAYEHDVRQYAEFLAGRDLSSFAESSLAIARAFFETLAEAD